MRQCLQAGDLVGIDFVDDNVEKHLFLEIETLQKSQALLRQTSLNTEEEIRQMRKTKHNIEKDLVDREAAVDIDSETSQLKVTGPMKKTRETRYPAPKPKQSFAPHSWQDFTEKNLAWANSKWMIIVSV